MAGVWVDDARIWVDVARTWVDDARFWVDDARIWVDERVDQRAPGRCAGSGRVAKHGARCARREKTKAGNGDGNDSETSPSPLRRPKARKKSRAIAPEKRRPPVGDRRRKGARSGGFRKRAGRSKAGFG